MWSVGWTARWRLRTAAWAYLKPLAVPDVDDPRVPMLFRKPADRAEVRDVSGEYAEAVDEMERLL